AARTAANAPALAAQPQARALAHTGRDRDEHVLGSRAVAESDALLAALGGFGHGEGHRDDDVGRAQRLRAWRTEQPTTGRREVTERATRRRQRRALAVGGAPVWRARSYWRRLAGSISTAYASLISLKRSSAAALPGLRSGWNSSARRR